MSAFVGLGIKISNVLCFETDLYRNLRQGLKIPELVYRLNKYDDVAISVEVKRIYSIGKHVDQFHRYWHWTNTVISGLSKVGDEITEFVKSEFNCIIKKHILVIVLPDTMKPVEISRIIKKVSNVSSKLTFNDNIKRYIVYQIASYKYFHDLNGTQ